MDCFCSVPRSIHCKIILLDEQELLHEIQDTNTGQAILDVVFRHLNLLETAYFGLRYMDIESQTHWIDPEKKLSRQLKGPDPYTLYFGVKFYAADPCKLLEEITRYQFFLQVKQDILQGRLPVSFELAAELGAYIVQSELGDYDSRRHSTGYVSEFRFLSNQTVELETRIIEIHKTLVGQLPSVAELNYLDKVKWLEMYGVDLHPVLGEDNVEYYLGLTPNGIIVLRNKNIVGNYFWPRISKIYFKGRYFMLRVTDKNNDESTYGFETPSKPACKHLWKCCVEHHAFFRLVQVSPTTSDIFAIGSRFRYSGRTEKQAIRDAQMRMRNPPLFLRTPSRRYQRRTHEDSLETNKLNESMNGDHYQSQEIKHVSIPQPAQLFDSPYRATCNTSTTTDVRNTVPGGDSPRSTRSAPWSQTHLRGLYNTMQPASPRSVRSAGPRYRSSSIDSQSSNDSKSCKRRRQHRSKWTSDNESELSKCSSRSHRKHKRHRSRGYKKDSGSEQDFHQHRHKSSHKNRHSEGHYELVDSGSQWREVQKRQEFNTNNIQQANVVVNRRAGYVNNGLETESEISSYHYRSKHRKHRSRSRSPSTAKTSWLPDELKKHLEFDLIDTTGMSESQLREIPYTVVETNHAKQLKLKNISRGKSDTSLQNEKILSYSPPPPYSPQISDVSRIRGGIRSNSSNSKRESPHSYTDFIGKPESSIASSSSTQSNSNMLPRMFDSLSLSNNNNQYQMSIRSVRSRASNNSSSLYGNSNSNRDGITNSSEMHLNQNLDNGIRVNHEHTDSGLGVEQECIYNNERSNNNSSKHEVNSSKHLNDGHGVPIQTPVSNLDCVLIQSNYNNNNSNINTDFRPSSRNSILDQYNHPVRSHFETVNNTKKNYYDSGNNGRLGGNSGNISVFRNVYTNRFDYNNSPKFTHNIYNTASFGSSSDEQKRLATTTENNNATIPATSLFRGSSNFSTTTTRHGYSHDSRYNLSTNSTSSGTNNTTASYLDIKDGPLRLQYRMGGHSVRSTRSTKSEGRTKDHSNQHFFYSSNQTVNANQINHLKVPSPLTDYKRNGNEENKSKITASNVIQDNHMCNGTRESAEMSTEL